MDFVVFLNGLVMAFFAALMVVVAVVFPDTAGVFGVSALLVGLAGALLSLST